MALAQSSADTVEILKSAPLLSTLWIHTEHRTMCLFQHRSSEARVWLAVVFLAFRQWPAGGDVLTLTLTLTLQHGCLFSRTLSPKHRCFQLCGSGHQIGQGATVGQRTLRLPESQWGEGARGRWGLQPEDRPSVPWSSSVHSTDTDYYFS